MAGVGSDRMHAAPCTRAHTRTRTLTVSVCRKGPARQLCVKDGKLPGLPKSNVSDNSPLQQGRLPEVSLYFGSSFNVIYAFCARNCGIFSPTVNNMEMLNKKKKSTLPALVPVRVWATRRSCPGVSQIAEKPRGKRERARARAEDAAAVSRVQALHPERRDAAPLRGGGAAGGRCHRAGHVGARRHDHWPEARVQETGPRRHSRGLG